MPYRQSPYPAYQAAPLFWRSRPVCGGISMKPVTSGPMTIHRKVTQALVLLCSPPVWQIKGEVGVSWVAGGIVCVRACVRVCTGSQVGPLRQVVIVSRDGWDPLGQSVCKGRTAPSPQHHPSAPLIQAGRGWGPSASVLCGRIERRMKAALGKKAWPVGSSCWRSLGACVVLICQADKPGPTWTLISRHCNCVVCTCACMYLILCECNLVHLHVEFKIWLF